MNIKHIMPAYSSAQDSMEKKRNRSRINNLLFRAKNFGRKLRRKGDRERFSPSITDHHSSDKKTSSSIKDRLPDIDVDKRSILKWAAITAISALILVGGVRLINSTPASGGSSNKGSALEVKPPKATQDLYKEFTFPLRNSQGEDVSTLKYTIEKVELRDEIIVQGKKATSIKGRTFLILTLKLTNEHTQAIEIDTKDYVRLSVNDNQEEWLAPDIHNDPVEVQAISTKYTRIGFPINDSDENLVLRVGEIRGDKEIIELDL